MEESTFAPEKETVLNLERSALAERSEIITTSAQTIKQNIDNLPEISTDRNINNSNNNNNINDQTNHQLVSLLKN